MTYRRADSLTVLVDQVNAIAPNRDKSSDGWIGDESHQNRSSDHNPWIWDDADDVWIVSAQDITNDPVHGMPSRALAEALVASKDKRIKYIISDEEICSGTDQSHTAWEWRKYTGSNPHTMHMHLSVKSSKAHYDDKTPWTIDMAAVEPGPVRPTLPVLQFGMKGPDVRYLQEQLNKQGYTIRIDSDFGPNTRKAVEAFQFESNLAVDGIVGPYTWEALLEPVEVTSLVGKVSWFGGPNDKGVAPDEGLAFITGVEQAPHLFLPYQPSGTTGLARRLNPYIHYIACRWDYDKTPKSMLLQEVALVRAGGIALKAFPADWGPNESTGRVADISPGLMDDLGIKTDDEVEVIFPYKPEEN